MSPAELPFEESDVIGPVAPTLQPGTNARRRGERRAMRRLMKKVDGVTFVEAVGELPHRPSMPKRDTNDDIVVRILDERAYSVVAREGSAGLGEAYFRGWFDTDDLVGALRAMIRAQDGLNELRNRLHHLGRPFFDPFRRLRRSDRHRDRQNVRAHYDLSNEFFETFLDETMTYSSAVFLSPDMTLADASRAKLERLCEKLDLSPATSVVEIGTGWGSFALHAAQERGADVVTTTISAAQAEKARERIAAAGLTNKIDLREQDYRELTGQFDRLVSIEMIEAVDWRDTPQFLATCASLLKPDGLMGLQAIVVADQRYARVRTTIDFIKRWVFPGGNLPSITSIADDATRVTDLRIVDLEDLGPHYAETLHRWRETLQDKWEQLHSLRVSEEMGRLWDCYLAYCEAAFLERHISVVQIILARPAWRPEPLRLRSL